MRTKVRYIGVDDIHWKINKLLSHNKPFNSVISAREGGKSSDIWRFLLKQRIEKGLRTIVIRRLISDITDTYIQDIEEVINKFLPDEEKIKLHFKKGGIKEGIVDVELDIDDETIPFFRVIALSNPIGRIKSLMYPDLGWIFFDEFIVNLRLKEKYLTDEAFKFKEIFNTFQRESNNLRCIFAGNPYSLYNPYFEWWKVPTKEIYPGSFYVGDNYIIECYKLTDELRAFILNRNPLYKFDDAYTEYAFDGRSINDINIRLADRLPDNFSLRYVFFIANRKLCIYRNNKVDKDNWYYIECDPKYTSMNRDTIVFDYNAMIDGSVLLSSDDKKMFFYLKTAFRCRKILFRTIADSYAFEQIYDKLI